MIKLINAVMLCCVLSAPVQASPFPAKAKGLCKQYFSGNTVLGWQYCVMVQVAPDFSGIDAQWNLQTETSVVVIRQHSRWYNQFHYSFPHFRGEILTDFFVEESGVNCWMDADSSGSGICFFPIEKLLHESSFD